MVVEILLECRLNGTLAAPEAAIQSCNALSKVCKFPANESEEIVAFSDIPGKWFYSLLRFWY